MVIGAAAYKTVVGLYQPGSTHMVGDGFPVRNLFPSNDLDRLVDPFLMLDYIGPCSFPPADRPRGVGEHPHRGFETVTILYEGVVAHRDSAGHAGVIGPGDVQWMTAGSGIVHEELHERNWAKRGGTLHAIQLWVNLPKVHKMAAPNYQTIRKEDIPTVELGQGAGPVRVIAGSYGGQRGPARTFTPLDLYDVELAADSRWEPVWPEGHAVSIFVLSGSLSINGVAPAGEAELVVCGRDGSRLLVESREHSRLLVMGGKPIEEPIARYGPFVMNTNAELAEAVRDYQTGRMGHLS
ncbi:MAG: pirin family protein [Nitrospira sp.]|nr:pirin family protein [Nitrospira sp.]